MPDVADSIWIAGPAGARRLLFWQDGAVAEIWHEVAAGKIGTIHNVRITRIFANQGRATAQLGNGTPLSIRTGKRDRLSSGQLARITIVAAPRDGKAWQAIIGARLVSPYFVFLPDDNGLFTSKSLAVDPSADTRAALTQQLEQHGGGAIMRRQAAGVDLAVLAADLMALSELWQSGLQHNADHDDTGLLHDAGGLRALASRHAPDVAIVDTEFNMDADEFATAYDDAIDNARNRAVYLPGGGVIWIERTHALTAIDLDSGTGTLATLMLDAPAVIAHQLRLRALTGLVAIDVPRASPAVARRFTADLETCFARDPRMPEILGRSRGGLLECRIAHGQPSLIDWLDQEQDAS